MYKTLADEFKEIIDIDNDDEDEDGDSIMAESTPTIV
jgi:hypothetical protein